MESSGSLTTLTGISTIPKPFFNVDPEILKALKHLDLTGRVTFDERKVSGSGAFGDISKAECNLKARGTVRVAVKRLRFYISEDIKLLFEKEIYVWSKLRHPNILPLLGYSFDEPTGYPLLVSEWMERGSAWTYVREHPGCNLLQLITGIAKGLAYLHEKRIVHSDIKSDNIVVSEFGEALICDFGCSRMIDASRSLANLSTGLKGTTRYAAFELLTSSAKHSTESDVWAFGMTELCTRKRPYHQYGDVQVLHAIISRTLPDLSSDLSTSIGCGSDSVVRDMSHKCDVNDMIRAICYNCWTFDPNERFSMMGILEALGSHRCSSPSTFSSNNTEYLGSSIQDDNTSDENDTSSALTNTKEPNSSSVSIVRNVPKLEYVLHQESMVRCVCFSREGTYVAVGSNRTVKVYHSIHAYSNPVYTLHAVPENPSCPDNYVRGLCFCPDEGKLAVGTDDAIVKIWSFQKPRIPVKKFKGHSRAIYSLSFSSEGKFLASGSEDSKVFIWKVDPILFARGEVDKVLSGPSKSPVTRVSIFTVSIFDDSQKVIAWSLGNTFPLIWDLTTGNLQVVFETNLYKQIDFAYALQCFPLSVVGRTGEDLVYWTVSTDERTGHLNTIVEKEKIFASCATTGGSVLACTMDNNRMWLVSGCNDGLIQLENIESRKVEEVQGHSGSIVSVDFAAFYRPVQDGGPLTLFVTGSDDKTAKIWSISTLNCQLSSNPNAESSVSSRTLHAGPSIPTTPRNTTRKRSHSQIEYANSELDQFPSNTSEPGRPINRARPNSQD